MEISLTCLPLQKLLKGLEACKVMAVPVRLESGGLWRSRSRAWSGEDTALSESFNRRSIHAEDDEEALKWAALEKLPTYDRLRKSVLSEVAATGSFKYHDVDVTTLSNDTRKRFIERVLQVAEVDNERFLTKLKQRIDRVGIAMPTIEVRFEHLNIEADARVGGRALPTLLNFTVNIIEGFLNYMKILPMALLLGPPGAGKTTLLTTLAGKPDRDLTLLQELSRREKEAGIKPDSDVDLFMKETSIEGQRTSLITDYVLKVLGLDICADTMVGNQMRRGISGGQKKRNLSEELSHPYDREKNHPAALSSSKYGVSKTNIFRACLSREWLLMKRNSFVYIFKTAQILVVGAVTMTMFLRTEMHHRTVNDGNLYMGALFFGLVHIMFNGFPELSMTVSRLPVFYKQRDLLFYPCWAYALPTWIVKIPLSLLEAGIWVCVTYYVIGFAPAAERFFRQFFLLFLMHQMSLALFKFIASLGRNMIVSQTFGSFALLIVFVLGGFVVSRENIPSWWIWAYWCSPMSYGQNAIAVNEFLASRWDKPVSNSSNKTVGRAVLESRGLFAEAKFYWIGVGALIGFCVLFNILYTVALACLNQRKDSLTSEDNSTHYGEASVAQVLAQHKKGMILPFQPLSMAFENINYYVDMPPEMKREGLAQDRLQLLSNVSGSFRPGVLTALMGVSGAGKTTLMDVLAGRKTEGYIEGNINISGFPKKQETFARISGYCEQNDIHSPNVTVFESLTYSAWLRLPCEVDEKTRMIFVAEVMELVELTPLRDALVGLPGVTGLSTEQRKRLTIAVELVANPSIIFMDEPTSGLDARAAAIVMRTVRNTVNTGRTVVCTIHQPSIDIFEAFDELLLLKRGGQIIYAGPLGRHSHKLIEYFEAVPEIPQIIEGYNPATWALEVSSIAVEERLGVDFVEIYRKSALYEWNQALIKELGTPAPGLQDLNFPTQYAQSFKVQCVACLWKQHWSYWRNPHYNVVRFFFTTVVALLFGTIFWDLGTKRGKQQDLMNIMGSMYCAVLFLGVSNSSSVQPVVEVERTVFYREKAAGMYSALPYALGQATVKLQLQ
eukprot:PITA_01138